MIYMIPFETGSSNVLPNIVLRNRHRERLATREMKRDLFFAGFICFSNTGELMYRRTKNFIKNCTIFTTLFFLFMEN